MSSVISCSACRKIILTRHRTVPSQDATASQQFFLCVHCSEGHYFCVSCETQAFLFHPWNHCFVLIENDINAISHFKNFLQQNLIEHHTITTMTHPGVICSQCNHSIRGTRFKGLQHNADLCSMCFENRNPPFRNCKIWLKIRTIFEIGCYISSIDDEILETSQSQEHHEELSEAPLCEYEDASEYIRSSNIKNNEQPQPEKNTLSVFPLDKYAYLESPALDFAEGENLYSVASDASQNSSNKNAERSLRNTNDIEQQSPLKSQTNAIYSYNYEKSQEKNSLPSSTNDTKTNNTNVHPLDKSEQTPSEDDENIIEGGTFHSYNTNSKASSSSALHSMDSSSEPDDRASSSVMERNWNEEFQRIFDEYCNSENPPESLLIALNKFSQEFMTRATQIGKIIVEEVSLPNDQKTIKPKSFGGVAGGEKYSEDGIFFKFAIDVHNLFGGDEFASKVAEQELVGLKAFFHAHVKGLHFPFMCLMDYKGYRLIATTKLPLEKGSLKYGSKDAGKTVFKSDKTLNTLMKEAAQKINLKKHKAGIVPGKEKNLYMPCDIEGHKGTDGRYYVLDTSRVCPPEPPQKNIRGFLIPHDESARSQANSRQRSKCIWQIWDPINPLDFVTSSYRAQCSLLLNPTQNPDIEILEENVLDGTLIYIKYRFQQSVTGEHFLVNSRASALAGKLIQGDAIFLVQSKGSHLYNLLRLEFVRQSPVPLSSDSFTSFDRSDQQKTNNREITDIYFQFISQKIPKFAEFLKSSGLLYSFSRQVLIQQMHQWGINVRYLGLLRSHLSGTDLSKRILIEMIARVSKNFLRKRLRQAHSERRSVEQVVADYLNLLFGNNSASLLFWRFFIKTQIESKFGKYCFALAPEELRLDYDLRTQFTRFDLLGSLKEVIGFELSIECLMRIGTMSDFDVRNPFTVRDIVGFKVKTKSLFVPEFLQSITQKLLKDDMNFEEKLNNCELLYGKRSPQVAWLLISEAYERHLRGTYDGTDEFIQNAFNLLNEYDTPIEVTLKGYYVRACHYEKMKKYGKAKAYLTAAYHFLVLATGNFQTSDDLCVFTQSESTNPFSLLLLNKLVNLHLEKNEFYEATLWAVRFHTIWRNLPFVGGTSLAIKTIFGSRIPKPLSILPAFMASNRTDHNSARNLVHDTITKLFGGNESQSTQHMTDWEKRVHMLGFDVFSGITLSPGLIEEYVAQKKYLDLSQLGHSVFLKVKAPYCQSLCFDQILAAGYYRKIKINFNCRFDFKFLTHLTVLLKDNTGNILQSVSVDIVPGANKIYFRNVALNPGVYVVESLHNNNIETAANLFVLSPERWNNGVLVTHDQFWDCTAVHIIPSENEQIATLAMWDQTEPSIYKPHEIQTSSSIIFTTTNGTAYINTEPNHSGAFDSSNRSQRLDSSSWRLIPQINAAFVQKVVCSSNHFVALTSDGNVFTWGVGNRGQLGHGGLSDTAAPRLVEKLRDCSIKDIFCGFERSFAIDENNSLYRWGKTISISPSKGNRSHAEPQNSDILVPTLEPFFASLQMRVVKVAVCQNCCDHRGTVDPIYYLTDSGEVWVPKDLNSIPSSYCPWEPLKDEWILDVTTSTSTALFINDKGQVFVTGSLPSDAPILTLTPNWRDYLVYPQAKQEIEPFQWVMRIEDFEEKKAVKVAAAQTYSYVLLEDGTLYFWESNMGYMRPVSYFQSHSISDFAAGGRGVVCVLGKPKPLQAVTADDWARRSLSHQRRFQNEQEQLQSQNTLQCICEGPKLIVKLHTSFDKKTHKLLNFIPLDAHILKMWDCPVLKTRQRFDLTPLFSENSQSQELVFDFETDDVDLRNKRIALGIPRGRYQLCFSVTDWKNKNDVKFQAKSEEICLDYPKVELLLPNKIAPAEHFIVKLKSNFQITKDIWIVLRQKSTRRLLSQVSALKGRKQGSYCIEATMICPLPGEMLVTVERIFDFAKGYADVFAEVPVTVRKPHYDPEELTWSIEQTGGLTCGQEMTVTWSFVKDSPHQIIGTEYIGIYDAKNQSGLPLLKQVPKTLLKIDTREGAIKVKLPYAPGDYIIRMICYDGSVDGIKVLGNIPIFVQAAAQEAQTEPQQATVSAPNQKSLMSQRQKYSSWLEFFLDCGLNKETAEKYAHLTVTKKFPIEKVHVLNPQFLDKLGIDDLTDQIAICEKVQTLNKL
jgi:hypothetical protein